MSFSRLGTPFHMLSCVVGGFLSLNKLGITAAVAFALTCVGGSDFACRELKKVEEKCKKPSAAE